MAKNFLKGGTVYNKKGEIETWEDDFDTLCLYFSASWCPPCQNFTPKLNEAYKQALAKGTKLKIVFVSDDKNEKECEDYYKKMDFSMLDFNSSVKDYLKSHFQVNSIPCLVI